MNEAVKKATVNNVTTQNENYKQKLNEIVISNFSILDFCKESIERNEAGKTEPKRYE